MTDKALTLTDMLAGLDASLNAYYRGLDGKHHQKFLRSIVLHLSYAIIPDEQHTRDLFSLFE